MRPAQPAYTAPIRNAAGTGQQRQKRFEDPVNRSLCTHTIDHEYGVPFDLFEDMTLQGNCYSNDRKSGKKT